MNPKKSNEFSKKVANELGVHEETVKEVMNFYWNRVRVGLSDLRHHSIKVLNLGTFKIRQRRIKGELEDAQRILESSDPTEFKHYAKYAYATDKLTKLNNLSQMLEEERERRQNIKLSRNEESDRSMEE